MRITMTAAATALALAAASVLAISPADAQRRHHGHHGRGGAAIAGFAAGALLGGALAPRPYYYAEPYAYYGGGSYDDGNADAYCFSRFKSYDPRSGTYLGYDGHRHPCP